MANISDAWGTITFSDTWTPFMIKTFVKLLQTFNGSDYTINVDYDITCKAIKEHIENNIILSDFKIDFIGTGRWTIMRNIESIGVWTDILKSNWDSYEGRLDALKDLTYEQYCYDRDNLFKYMKRNNKTISFEYTDYEPGCGNLYEGSTIINSELTFTKDNCNSSYKLEYCSDVSQTYDCNLKNYTEIYAEGDDEELCNVVSQLSDLYSLSTRQKGALITLIRNHVTYYDLPSYSNFEDKDEVPDNISNLIAKIVVEVVG